MTEKKKNKIIRLFKFNEIEIEILIMMLITAFIISYIWNEYYASSFLFGGAFFIGYAQLFYKFRRKK